jgi:hypothetical protein
MPQPTTAVIGAGVSGTSLSLWLQASSLWARGSARGVGKRLAEMATGNGRNRPLTGRVASKSALRKWTQGKPNRLPDRNSKQIILFSRLILHFKRRMFSYHLEQSAQAVLAKR